MLYFISDLHINANEFESKRWEFTRRNLLITLNSIKSSLEWNFNALIIAWDIYHDRTKDFRKYELWFAEELIQFSKSCKEKDKEFKVFIITWNHDCSNTLWENTAISWFVKYWTNLVETIESNLQTIKHWEFDITFAPFPFLHQYRKKWEYLEFIKEEAKTLKSKKKILVSHFIINWNTASNHWWFTSRNVFVTDKELRNLWYDYVVLWDNHSHYIDNWIISVWSLEQVSFNEEWEEKFLVWINDKLEAEVFWLQNKTMSTIFLEFNSDADVKTELKEKLKWLETKDKNLRLKIVLKEEDENSASKMKIIEETIKELWITDSLSLETHYSFQDTNNEVILDDNFLDDFWNEETMLKKVLSKLNWKITDKESIRFIERSKNLMFPWKTVDEIMEKILTDNTK